MYCYYHHYYVTKDRAEDDAFDTYRRNLRTKLLAPPLRMHPEWGRAPVSAVLGIDPAFRTGCKLALVAAGTGQVREGYYYYYYYYYYCCCCCCRCYYYYYYYYYCAAAAATATSTTAAPTTTTTTTTTTSNDNDNDNDNNNDNKQTHNDINDNKDSDNDDNTSNSNDNNEVLKTGAVYPHAMTPGAQTRPEAAAEASVSLYCILYDLILCYVLIILRLHVILCYSIPFDSIPFHSYYINCIVFYYIISYHISFRSTPLINKY